MLKYCYKHGRTCLIVLPWLRNCGFTHATVPSQIHILLDKFKSHIISVARRPRNVLNIQIFSCADTNLAIGNSYLTPTSTTKKLSFLKVKPFSSIVCPRLAMGSNSLKQRYIESKNVLFVKLDQPDTLTQCRLNWLRDFDKSFMSLSSRT